MAGQDITRDEARKIADDIIDPFDGAYDREPLDEVGEVVAKVEAEAKEQEQDEQEQDEGDD